MYTGEEIKIGMSKDDNIIVLRPNRYPQYPSIVEDLGAWAEILASGVDECISFIQSNREYITEYDPLDVCRHILRRCL